MPNILTWNQGPTLNTFVVCSAATARGADPCATDEERERNHQSFTYAAEGGEKYSGGPKFTTDEWASQCATEALRLVQAATAVAQPPAQTEGNVAALTIPAVL